MTMVGLSSNGYRVSVSQASCGWIANLRHADGRSFYTARYRQTKKSAMNDARKACGGSEIEWSEVQ